MPDTQWTPYDAEIYAINEKDIWGASDFKSIGSLTDKAEGYRRALADLAAQPASPPIEMDVETLARFIKHQQGVWLVSDFDIRGDFTIHLARNLLSWAIVTKRPVGHEVKSPQTDEADGP